MTVKELWSCKEGRINKYMPFTILGTGGYFLFGKQRARGHSVRMSNTVNVLLLLVPILDQCLVPDAFLLSGHSHVITHEQFCCFLPKPILK